MTIRDCQPVGLNVPARRPTGPLTAAAARRWLADYGEQPEHASTEELLRAARRNVTYEPVGHPDRQRIDLCAALIAAEEA